ncbi:MAG: hypothetical protein EOM68_26300 [Spirochaetia bacterium]|nr:hypothetical protein [Spirochaetia bacterium]
MIGANDRQQIGGHPQQHAADQEEKEGGSKRGGRIPWQWIDGTDEGDEPEGEHLEGEQEGEGTAGPEGVYTYPKLFSLLPW